ncbi:MAG TPA: hypothetical protein VM452_12335 [Caulifigura sp.]|nr:hypothetical protein [Caulifigura sp.]
MRVLRTCSIIAWLAAAVCVWLLERPLVPDVVIRPVTSSPILQTFADGRLLTSRGLHESDNFQLTGPISWYDRRSGRLIKEVFDSQHRDIQGSLLPGRPPIADLKVQGKRVVADLWAGEILVTLPGETADNPYFVSPDGRYLAWHSEGVAHVIDLRNKEVVLTRQAVSVLGFHGAEILRIRMREQATDSEQDEPESRLRELALMLPDGAVVETDSPLDHSALLSSDGKRLLKTSQALQAAVCDPRTGAVIWQTQIPYPTTPGVVRPDMFSFDASGDEVRALYADEEGGSPRLARWSAADGRVIAPMPVAFREPHTIVGINFDATGTPIYVESSFQPYDGFDGHLASEGGRFIIHEVDSSWELAQFHFEAVLEAIENYIPLGAVTQLLAVGDDSDELSPLGIFDVTTGRQVGKIPGGEVKTAPDFTWFAVEDGSEIRVYSAPFQLSWRHLFLWAVAPPAVFVFLVNVLRRLRQRCRRMDHAPA